MSTAPNITSGQTAANSALPSKPVLPTSLANTKSPAVGQGIAKSAKQAVASTVSLSETTGVWKRYFQDWPEAIPRRGILVNRLGEQIPFKAFMTQAEVVLLERTNPDTLGARFLVVPYCEVGIVKLTDPLKQSVFEESGYQGKLSM